LFAAVFDSSAVETASSTRSSQINSSSLRDSAGISSKSFRFRAGSMTRLRPAPHRLRAARREVELVLEPIVGRLACVDRATKNHAGLRAIRLSHVRPPRSRRSGLRTFSSRRNGTRPIGPSDLTGDNCEGPKAPAVPFEPIGMDKHVMGDRHSRTSRVPAVNEIGGAA
jgi:hypothetical protein